MATSKNIKAVQKKSAPFVSSVKSVFQNYAPAPESSDHIQLKPQYNLFINGKFVKPLSKNSLLTLILLNLSMTSALKSLLFNTQNSENKLSMPLV
jgi:hypothetical protein